MLSHRIQVRTYERRGDLRDDRVAVGAQSSHSLGYPMSQRECAGFNWPGFPVSAGEPLDTTPRATVVGVGQLASGGAVFSTTVARLLLRLLKCPSPADWGSRSPVLCAFGLWVAPCAWSSRVAGVGHIANFAACSRLAVCFRPSVVRPVASIFSTDMERPPFGVQGLGHEPQSLSPMGRADAVCAQYARPNRVVSRFQVQRHSIEPSEPSRAANLLAKDCDRMALADEIVPCGPEVALVSVALPFARSREWLAGARACPNRSVSPAGELEGVGPAPDPGEEVALREVLDIARHYLLYRAAVHFAPWDQPFAHQIL